MLALRTGKSGRPTTARWDSGQDRRRRVCRLADGVRRPSRGWQEITRLRPAVPGRVVHRSARGRYLPCRPSTEHINGLCLRLLTEGKPCAASSLRSTGRSAPAGTCGRDRTEDPRRPLARTRPRHHPQLARCEPGRQGCPAPARHRRPDCHGAEPGSRPAPTRPSPARGPRTVLLSPGGVVRRHRRGEPAVHCSVVNMTLGTITLASVVSVGKAGPIVREQTKTKRGVRQVSVDAVTLDLLRDHHTRQVERVLACGTRLIDDPFVFSSEVPEAAPSIPAI